MAFDTSASLRAVPLGDDARRSHVRFLTWHRVSRHGIPCLRLGRLPFLVFRESWIGHLVRRGITEARYPQDAVARRVRQACWALPAPWPEPDVLRQGARRVPRRCRRFGCTGQIGRGAPPNSASCGLRRTRPCRVIVGRDWGFSLNIAWGKCAGPGPVRWTRLCTGVRALRCSRAFCGCAGLEAARQLVRSLYHYIPIYLETRCIVWHNP